MAVSKILHMKDSGNHFHGKHLKRAIDYIMNPDKTQNGRLVSAVNCQADRAFEQMRATKSKFGKTDKRQGYHIILSFKENEVDPDTAFELTGKFVEEYLGEAYEAVYAVHDNTDHVHSHIVFNSVSFLDGKKYRYEKGDWAKEIQPITNRLCRQYGLSVIDVEEENRERKQETYTDRREERDGNSVWNEMIRLDLDACVLQAGDFETFLELLRDKEYEIKQGKYLAVRPPGMTRFKRCRSLGEDYTEERLRERIETEDLSYYRSLGMTRPPRIAKCRIKKFRRAELSGLQKKYFARLYRIGKLKKKPYSQVWKYKDEIRKMKKLQEQYLFLTRHEIHSPEELTAVISSLTGKKKEASREKSRIYKEKNRFQKLFEVLDERENLKDAEASYQNGETFFQEEHERWEQLGQRLQKEGYTPEEAAAIRKKYDSDYADSCVKEKAVFKELNLGKSIWKDLVDNREDVEREKNYELENSRDTREQPKR